MLTTITRTYTSARGNIVTITRPELTPEERAKRMQQIKDAAVRLVLETERTKRQKGKKES